MYLTQSLDLSQYWPANNFRCHQCESRGTLFGSKQHTVALRIKKPDPDATGQKAFILRWIGLTCACADEHLEQVARIIREDKYGGQCGVAMLPVVVRPYVLERLGLNQIEIRWRRGELLKQRLDVVMFLMLVVCSAFYASSQRVADSSGGRALSALRKVAGYIPAI